MLQATSIHGDGDKIALPPSVLTFLTESSVGNNDNDEMMMPLSSADGSPWIFRIGILNPDYTFPASPLLKNMTFPDEDDEMDVEDDIDSEDESDDDDDERNPKEAFLDELRYRYLAYTHGTVVEFTQDEGHVGLPEPIAKVLLLANKRSQAHSTVIPVKRTVDPAKVSQDANDDEQNVEAMMKNEGDDDDDEKTPGHLAYGAFDIPDLPIEISMVKIPKGKTCQLVPTREAIANGFYNLKDVKLVLEQSLIRTRATLSVGDVLHTWHRGIKFDLTVSQVTPAMYQTVTCINTDIEVDFGEVPGLSETTKAEEMDQNTTGYTLGSSSSSDVPIAATIPAAKMKAKADHLVPEPPTAQTEGVCTIQIRAGAGHGRRRFDVNKATLNDLFAFSSTIDGIPDRFQLVSRFPRREFRLDAASGKMTLREAGLQAGQELLLVEKV